MVQSAALSPEVEAHQIRRAAIGSTIGTAIEWYDFFLYGTAAALVFPKLFFPKSDAFVGILLAFTTYALGFAARPIGAAIFGHYGDRIGRKATLIVTLLLMGISSTLIGVMPTHQSIGVWAPILLTVLRVLQGIGVGGEWGGSVLLSMEWGNKKRRGLMASFPQMGVSFGLISSAGMVSLFTAISGKGFDTWGWRLPFLFSIVLVIVGLVLRLRVYETPVFQKVLTEQRASQVPVKDAFKYSSKEIILSALARMSEQAPFYLFTAFVVNYVTKDLGLGKSLVTSGIMFAGILSLGSVPLFGHLSDRIGRKRMYLIGSVVTLLFAFPYFGMLNTKNAAIVFIAIVISLIPHDMQYGPQAALIAENFPPRYRYSGASIGYQLASVIAGGPAPLVAVWLFHKYGTSTSIAAYIIFNCVVTIIAVSMMKERYKQDVDSEAVFSDGGVSA